MSASQIFLIVVSGLGVVHGLFLAVFLWFYTKGNRLSNRLLSLLLVILSFRVGKSVFLEFTENLDVTFILMGLGTMMAIGPLFYFFIKSSTDKTFEFSGKHLWHFIPALIAVCFGAWINEVRFEELPKILFASLFLIYYGHFLGYLIQSGWYISNQKKQGLNPEVYQFLRILLFGLLIIWVAYVLNLLDELIPYVAGPVLYSAVAYIISFIVIQKGYINKLDHSKYKTTPVSNEQVEQIFARVLELVVDQKKFKDAELTLKRLSETIKVSPQVLSLVINQKSEKNFNNFINQYRIENAVELLNETSRQNHTISAIAFDVGFNSISSFNSAFKKQVGKTPKSYREEIAK